MVSRNHGNDGTYLTEENSVVEAITSGFASDPADEPSCWRFCQPPNPGAKTFLEDDSRMTDSSASATGKIENAKTKIHKTISPAPPAVMCPISLNSDAAI